MDINKNLPVFFFFGNRNIKEEVIIKGIIEMKQENTKIIVKQDIF